MFNYDWWFAGNFNERLTMAKRRCALSRFPDLDAAKASDNKKFKRFLEELEARTIIYLRDGFSYEIKEILPASNTSILTFECVAADDAYKVGCFVVSLPYDDVVRVEVFAVHPNEKPEDMPAIKGFGGGQAIAKRGEPPMARGEAAD